MLQLSDRMQIDSSLLFIDGLTERIGIGTTNPQNKLDIMGDLGISGQIFGLSDRRLKIDPTAISNASEILMKLEPMSYYFDRQNFSELNLPTQKQYGLIAQDVEMILPELVSSMPSNSEAYNYKSVNYNALISILVSAYKEQEIRISSLEKRIRQSGI